jgi:transcriptional regulator with GAF, ATPase, and Fis domain
MPRNTTSEPSELRRERKAKRRLREESPRLFAHDNVIGQSRGIQSILEMVRTAAYTSSTVLITGGSATGKELVVRAIHETRPRRDG